MEHTSAAQFDHQYLQRSTDEEIALSDDSEVSVANMNRHSDNVVTELEEDEKTCTDVEGENEEVVSDDEYSYSEDSIYSDDSCRASDMTNVTPRSSVSAGSPLNRTLSLEYPIGRRNEEIERGESTPPREGFENVRENGLLRTCLSANDNRYSINNNPHLQSNHARSRRRNMSFTNMEMHKIERENQFLLKKIMAQHKSPSKPMRILSAQPKVSSSAINRKKLQKRIEEENMMLLRRIHGAKPCAVSTNTTPGYRVTSL